MQIPGQPETLSLVKSNTKTYLSLILRLPAQWVHQQARTNHHCHGCPCEAVGKPWLNWEGCLSESVRVCQLFHTSEHVAEEGLLSVIKEKNVLHVETSILVALMVTEAAMNSLMALSMLCSHGE
ncbi:uncharacterized protein LOC118519358 isoform X2 [Halichoerus grypus]